MNPFYNTEKTIVYLCPNGFIGGAEKFVLEAAKGHLEFGKWHPVIIFFKDGEGPRLAKKYGISFFLLKSKFRLSRPLSLFKAVLELRSLFKENGFKFYNATMPYAHIVGSLATIGLNIKKTWYQHGPVGGLLDMIASFFAVHQTYFNSAFTREEHYRSVLFQKSSDRDSIIPLGIPESEVDLETVENIRKEFHGESGPLFLMAGRICSWKGFHLGIEAFHNYCKKLKNKEAKLLILGAPSSDKDVPYLESLKAMVTGFGLNNQILFLGKKENLSEYMKASDSFIHASTTPEPFGLVVAEAMKLETLVIGANRGGVNDILTDKETGYSYDTLGRDAPKKLASLMERSFKSSPSEITKRAKSLIDLNYSIKGMINNLENEFDRLGE